MSNQEVNIPGPPIRILLADDDSDDHFFFDRALKTLPFHIQFSAVKDGEELITHLFENSENLPDILFLDNNMPRKNGCESLIEIKSDPRLQGLPVIIYSTYLDEDIADMLYNNGAHFYIRKTDLAILKKVLHNVFTLVIEKKFHRPERDRFILSPARYNS